MSMCQGAGGGEHVVSSGNNPLSEADMDAHTLSSCSRIWGGGGSSSGVRL